MKTLRKMDLRQTGHKTSVGPLLCHMKALLGYPKGALVQYSKMFSDFEEKTGIFIHRTYSIRNCLYIVENNFLPYILMNKDLGAFTD